MRSTLNPRDLVILGFVFLAASCAQDGDAARDGRVATSMLVRPIDIDAAPTEADREVESPPVPTLSPIPFETISRLDRDLTREEVIDLLGPPTSEELIEQEGDSQGRDWNGLIIVWQYQDDRLTTMSLPRDLRLRFAMADNGRPWPRRPQVRGPSWMLLDWRLE